MTPSVQNFKRFYLFFHENNIYCASLPGVINKCLQDVHHPTSAMSWPNSLISFHLLRLYSKCISAVSRGRHSTHFRRDECLMQSKGSGSNRHVNILMVSMTLKGDGGSAARGSCACFCVHVPRVCMCMCVHVCVCKTTLAQDCLTCELTNSQTDRRGSIGETVDSCLDGIWFSFATSNNAKYQGDRGASQARHWSLRVSACVCVDAAGGRRDNAKEDHSGVQCVLSEGMLGYTVRLTLTFVNTHAGVPSLLGHGFLLINTHKHALCTKCSINIVT